jgi:hypothetical protein
MPVSSLQQFVHEHPLRVWWGVSLLLAIISGIVWPTVPSYDPFSWVVWGHEVTASHIPFLVGGGPSWKPLPFIFTTIWGLFGSAAPWLWVVTARVGGIAGLICAFRLAYMLCGRARLPWYAGVAAGVVAIAGIVLSWPQSPWSYYFFRGASEVLLIGVWLWAIDRFVAGRHWQAYMLVAAEGLMRPEAWPFLLVYGIWLWFNHPSMRIWVVAGLVLQPLGWFGPPWISEGDPFLAATHAHEYNGNLGSDWLKTLLTRGEQMQALPILGFAVVAAILALWRGRDRIILGLVGVVIAWWIIVIAETDRGYPGLQRFFLPGTAVTCVLGGVGVVWLASVIAELLTVDLGRLITRAGRTLARLRTPIAILAGLVMIVGSWHWATTSSASIPSRWDTVKQQEPLARYAVKEIDDLGVAIKQLGGLHEILPCADSKLTINHSLQTALAWKLGTNLERVQTVLNKPGGLAFLLPKSTVAGGDPPVEFTFQTKTIATVGNVEVQEVWPVGAKYPSCGGH